MVIDSAIACIGGLDLCYGRWDTHNFSMADVHPDDLRATALPGQDFSDARVQDFENVQAWAGNQQARTDIPRLGWHDLHCMLIGPAVIDIAQHFIERFVFPVNSPAAGLADIMRNLSDHTAGTSQLP